jgi:hypothetical protein
MVIASSTVFPAIVAASEMMEVYLDGAPGDVVNAIVRCFRVRKGIRH